MPATPSAPTAPIPTPGGAPPITSEPDAVTPPLPAVTVDTEAFWTRGAAGELAVNRCADCHRYTHPPVPICPHCLSRDVAAEAVSGNATVAAFTVNHYPWHPAFPPPYVVAVVELVEQTDVRLTTRLVNVDPDAVTVGMPVQVVFEQHGEVFLPLFTPISDQPEATAGV